jgi:FkbM family methyltransferase
MESLKKSSLKLLKERGINVGNILDIGVHLGTPELIELYPEKKHILFEPVAEFTDGIRQTYKAIDYELHNAAISDTDGDVGLILSAPAGGNTPTHSVVTPIALDEQMRTVAKRRLDTLANASSWTPPYFLKIDVDGHEMAVLSGATETLSHTSIIMIEAQKCRLARLIGCLNDSGFELYDLVEPCYYDGSFWQCDAILIRKEIHRAHFRELGVTYDPSLYKVTR